ncbi:PilZ domain-containing protein [Flocculibacter collagenilyticus]|uniref:PilZ domain-containing protein n=1 Tax=Flocculibacter collagenilyticus TaxID=2744479 RepID=UPI0018F67CB1|nr:PilZ domain-containing protein [Flocculibacter collagenilyticus]
MITPDLEPYSDLIEELKPSLKLADFDNRFKKATNKLAKPKALLVKMELKRLAQPCSRFIDLRGKVDGEVITYEHNDRMHFMDDIAIDAFESALKLYGGYTMGVYEEVMNTDNNFRVMQKSDSTGAGPKSSGKGQGSSNYPAQQIVFASYGSRSEERMNYTISIDVKLDEKNTISAKSVDLSVTGCKLKILKKYAVELGQQVVLYFVGLKQEFSLSLKEDIHYKIVGIEPDGEHQYVRLSRLETSNQAELDTFLENFIRGNKRRYRINLDNTLNAVLTKGYEQFYFPRTVSMAAVITAKNEQLTLSSVLCTENCTDILRYFTNEDQNNILRQILTPQRIEDILAQKGNLSATTLYCFTHTQNSKIHHYSATALELLAEPELKPVFLGFGSHKKGWRVFNIQVHVVSPDDAHIPLSLPDTTSEEIKRLNKPPSPRVQAYIKDAKYLVVISDLTTEASQQQYGAISYDKKQVSKLNRWHHKKLKSYTHFEVTHAQYINLRTEFRYLYKTKILLQNQPEGDISGTTRDFSVNGLQIELDRPTQLKKGDMVLVALPEMQGITSELKLTRIPYEVVAVSKAGNIVNLRAYVITKDHAGKLFFQKVIRHNHKKLVKAEHEPKVPGLSDAIRNIRAKNFANLTFFINRKGIRYTLKALGEGEYPTYAHKILSRFKTADDEYNTYPFQKNDVINTRLSDDLKAMSRGDKPATYDVYVRFRPHLRTFDEAILAYYDCDFEDKASREKFIKNTIESDIFFCFRIFISRTGRPDTDYIANELQYVSQYAIHKAKVLEQDLWGVIAVGEGIDISEETMIRSGISNEKIIQQLKQRRLIK